MLAAHGRIAVGGKGPESEDLAPLSLDQGPELLRCSRGPDSAAEGAGLLCTAGISTSLQELDALILPLHRRWGGDLWARSQSGAGPFSATHDCWVEQGTAGRQGEFPGDGVVSTLEMMTVYLRPIVCPAGLSKWR